MKKLWQKLAFALILIFILGLVGAIFSVDEFLRQKLQTEVRESCATCALEIGNLHLRLLDPGEVHLTDVHLTTGTKGAFEVDARIESIVLKINPRELFNHQLEFERVIIEKPTVRLTDGDVHPAPDKPDDSPAAEWTFALNTTEVHFGTLDYTRNHVGTHAHIHVHDVQIKLGQLGNRPPLSEQTVEGTGQAQVEKSGEVWLKVSTTPFKKPLFIDLTLDVKKQNLADLTPFFKANAGVNLEGILRTGHAQVSVRGSSLKATLAADYQDLKITLEKMYDRNELTAFFMNLGTAVTMSKKNVDKPKEDKLRDVELSREGSESIVGFILRGLKEAALKVAQAG